MLNVVVGFAQAGGPCGLTDDDGNCPLDTWVVVLAIIGVVFGAVHLYRKGEHKPFEL